MDADVRHINDVITVAKVPVVKHPTENLYVPEMVFGHLLT